VIESGKHSSLLRYGINHGRKKFFVAGPQLGFEFGPPSYIKKSNHSLRNLALFFHQNKMNCNFVLLCFGFWFFLTKQKHWREHANFSMCLEWYFELMTEEFKNICHLAKLLSFNLFMLIF
jgi:hypothetical protein